MNILFLAPQPFFQERGTPIAVRLALKVLSKREGDSIDLLTFAEGDDISIPNVKIFRIWSPTFLRGIRPGFSFKKLICDIIFFIYALLKIVNSKLTGQSYAIVHAVEESVFMALVYKYIFKIPYIYDMDSSLSMQLTEKLPYLKCFQFIFNWFEAKAISNSLAVIPVCDALAEIAQSKMAKHVKVLSDISLSSEEEQNVSNPNSVNLNLRAEIGIQASDKILLYVGNLEHYQGVELLIDAFSLIATNFPDWYLVIIGGADKHIIKNRKNIAARGLEEKIHLLGPRAVSLLSHYLKQADILASPRIKGNNTPMKIYSYMHSGVAIIATNIASHSQVLNDLMAKLVAPQQESFAAGLKDLFSSESLRASYARAAFDEANNKYTFTVFSQTLLSIYQNVEDRLKKTDHR